MSLPASVTTNYTMVKLSERHNIILGELIEETHHELILNCPIIVNLYTDDDGQLSMSSAKFFMFAEDERVSILKTQIVSVAKPRQEFVQYYLKFLDRFKSKIHNDLEPYLLDFDDSMSPEQLTADDTVPQGTVIH